MLNEFTQLAIEVQTAIADGNYTHQKYLRFRTWYFKSHKGSMRNAARDFAMFELMYGLDINIKREDNEDV
jgi:hypothetical protein